MILKDILSISGEGGLFKFIAQGKNSIIVEHLETKKRTAAYGTAKVSSLEDISIFGESEDIPLSEVFNRIFDKAEGGSSIDHKLSGAKLSAYFEEVVPEYDKERVYMSDIKKMISWYNILHSLNLLEREKPEEEVEQKPEEVSVKKPKEETKKKSAKVVAKKTPKTKKEE
jgi:hypothetical protein